MPQNLRIHDPEGVTKALKNLQDGRAKLLTRLDEPDADTVESLRRQLDDLDNVIANLRRSLMGVVPKRSVETFRYR